MLPARGIVEVLAHESSGVWPSSVQTFQAVCVPASLRPTAPRIDLELFNRD